MDEGCCTATVVVVVVVVVAAADRWFGETASRETRTSPVFRCWAGEPKFSPAIIFRMIQTIVTGRSAICKRWMRRRVTSLRLFSNHNTLGRR